MDHVAADVGAQGEAFLFQGGQAVAFFMTQVGQTPQTRGFLLTMDFPSPAANGPVLPSIRIMT